MYKKILIFFILPITCVILIGSYLYASNLDYATNNSPEYFRNPAGRTSAQDSADIATNNPAGSIRLGTGLFINVSNQTIIKKYAVEDRMTGQEYESNEPDLIVPNLYVILNPQDSRFSFWGHVGIIGGGGTLYYADGAPVVNRVLAAAMTSIDSTVIGSGGTGPFSGLGVADMTGNAATDFYNIYSAMDKYHFSVLQQSYQICQAFGTTYSVSENLSVAIGARVVESFKQNEIYQSSGTAAAQKFIDVEMTATGIQGILGINYRPVSNLNLALTYETVNKMKYKVNVKSNGTDKWGTLSSTLTSALGMEDGKKFNYDMPHRFMAGATYNITPDFDVTVSGILYINDGYGVKIETGTNDSHTLKYMNSYAYEIGTGFDWKLTKQVIWSAGFVWDNMNQNTEYMNEVNYHPNVYIVNTGFMFKVDENLNVNIGFGRNFFPDTNNSKSKAYNDEAGIAEPALGTTGLQTANTILSTYGDPIARDLTFKKETWVTAVGAQYRFQ